MQQKQTHGGVTAAKPKMQATGLWGKWDQESTKCKEAETPATFCHVAESSWWTEAILFGG